MKKGEVVRIYHDPLTQKSPEGDATLLKCINPFHAKFEKGLVERWIVRFIGPDKAEVERNIFVATGNTEVREYFVKKFLPYKQYLKEARKKFGRKFDSSLLMKKFVRPYDSRERISVMIGGVKKKGYVGITTGWEPFFVLCHLKADRQGREVLTKAAEIL